MRDESKSERVGVRVYKLVLTRYEELAARPFDIPEEEGIQYLVTNIVKERGRQRYLIVPGSLYTRGGFSFGLEKLTAFEFPTRKMRKAFLEKARERLRRRILPDPFRWFKR